MIRADPIAPDPAIGAEIKAYLRLDGTDEDALVARLAAVALAQAEAVTGRVLVARGLTETVAPGCDWCRLGAEPVAAITAVTAGVDPPAGTAPLPVAAYAVDIDADGRGWVRFTAAPVPPRATVHYQAGLATTWGQLPEPLRQGVVRLAAHFFTNRDSAEEGAPPAAVAALLRPWRRTRLT